MWRLLVDDGATGSGGLATDEMLAGRVAAGLSQPVLRLYTYRAHAALVGRFQDVRHEVRVDWCQENGIDINRRPTGGGAIIMGPNQLGVSLAVPRRTAGFDGGARELMGRFSSGVAEGLARLGVAAGFRGKNDLEVDGRKIAGLGVHRAGSGGLLFHGSLLVDLDVALMSRVLSLPFDAVTDTELATLSDRTTTVRTLRNDEISMDAVRTNVAAGFADAFDVDLEPGELSAEECADAARLEQDKYRCHAWIWQQASVPDATGQVSVETPGGRLQVGVRLAGGMIKAMAVRGDFFASAPALADLEGRMRWHEAGADAIARTVTAAWPGDATVDAKTLTAAVVSAVANARETEGASTPYGCFVTPEAAHG